MMTIVVLLAVMLMLMLMLFSTVMVLIDMTLTPCSFQVKVHRCVYKTTAGWGALVTCHIASFSD
jgi:hypothetical protein